MKILLVNKFRYPKGGDAISTLATVALLGSRGHEAALWGMRHPGNLELLLDAAAGIEVHFINENIAVRVRWTLFILHAPKYNLMAL